MSKNDKRETKKVEELREAEAKAKELEEQKRKEREQLELKARIKEMENKKREEAMKRAAEANKEAAIFFDSWWTLRSAKIGKAHLKEIVRADMTARGLKEEETVKRFDEALEQYGVKLA